MNGAEAALRAAQDAGVEVCFANPGTTEMELVAAFDADDVRVRPVLGLFEGVVTGAADGYGRVAGAPALTLTHLGPGFANGIANLHNARRAGSPVVNLVGDHASWHLAADAPLASDITSLATPVSRWVRTATDAGALAGDVRAAIRMSMGPPAGPATLIVPQDVAWGEAAGGNDPGPATPGQPEAFDAEAVEQAATALRAGAGAGVAVLVGGIVRAEALTALEGIRTTTGCATWLDTFPAVVERGAGRPVVDQVPYFPEQGTEALAGVRTLVVVGTKAPVAFFGYRSVGRSSLLPDGTQVIQVSGPGWPPGPGLRALAAAVGAEDAKPPVDAPIPGAPDSGALDVASMGAVVAALQPEDAVVVNEAATSGLWWATASMGARPHEVLSLTGGAIGQGLPCAVGAAIAAPGRRTIALQADGSGMYTLQALWTMAREGLDVTVVVCANRLYRILQIELRRTGTSEAGPGAISLTDLGRPDIDWVSLAKGLGVPASRATTVEELRGALETSFASPGPALVEAVI